MAQRKYQLRGERVSMQPKRPAKTRKKTVPKTVNALKKAREIVASGDHVESRWMGWLRRYVMPPKYVFFTVFGALLAFVKDPEGNIAIFSLLSHYFPSLDTVTLGRLQELHMHYNDRVAGRFTSLAEVFGGEWKSMLPQYLIAIFTGAPVVKLHDARATRMADASTMAAAGVVASLFNLGMAACTNLAARTAAQYAGNQTLKYLLETKITDVPKYTSIAHSYVPTSKGSFVGEKRGEALQLWTVKLCEAQVLQGSKHKPTAMFGERVVQQIRSYLSLL